MANIYILFFEQRFVNWAPLKIDHMTDTVDVTGFHVHIIHILTVDPE